VTHITLSKSSNSKPCLEFYANTGGELRRITLETFPFRIGRAETANLRVESAEVSREHAEIFERNGICLVRDLGSTNGTQVNGKSIRETLLADGDILRVAEIEMTFIASAASQFQRMVTQPIHSKKPACRVSALPPEIVANRMLTEATLWQAVPTKLLAATSLRHHDIDAYFSTLSRNWKQPTDFTSSALDRYRELERMVALETAVEQHAANRLFVAVSNAELDTPYHLFPSLKQLQMSLPSAWELGITISIPTDVDILRIADVYRQARELDLLIAFDEFQGNGDQVMHLSSFIPDYLVLAVNMTKDLAATRQPLRRLESVLAACDELSVKPVLKRIEAGPALAFCQDLGFDLVLLPADQAAPARAELCATAW
jgi:EAL domain-containing protein (putative c-di-GMP-specific phosphodiesterase class I)